MLSYFFWYDVNEHHQVPIESYRVKSFENVRYKTNSWIIFIVVILGTTLIDLLIVVDVVTNEIMKFLVEQLIVVVQDQSVCARSTLLGWLFDESVEFFQVETVRRVFARGRRFTIFIGQITRIAKVSRCFRQIFVLFLENQPVEKSVDLFALTVIVPLLLSLFD